MESSGTSTCPDKLSLTLRALLQSKTWFEGVDIIKSWKNAMIILFLVSLFEENAWLLVTPLSSGKPVLNLIGKTLLSFTWKILFLFVWAILVDSSAQLKGYQGRIKKIFIHFIFVQAVFLLLLPWTVIFWGLDLYPLFFYFLGTLFCVIWVTSRQINSIKAVYEVSDTDKVRIFIFPLLLIIGFAVFLVVSLVFRAVLLFA